MQVFVHSGIIELSISIELMDEEHSGSVIVLDWRLNGHWSETCRRHCVVSLSFICLVY